MGQFRYTDISWIFYMSGSSAFWDLAGLPSFLPVYGVTPDSSVVVRISAEVVFAHFLVLVSVRFLISPALALFPRRCLCHLTFVPFSSARLTIWWKNITQVIVVMVSGKSMCISEGHGGAGTCWLAGQRLRTAYIALPIICNLFSDFFPFHSVVFDRFLMFPSCYWEGVAVFPTPL